MDKDDELLLDRLVEKYGLVLVLSTISRICGDRGEIAAEVWQHTPMGKFWIQIAFWVAGLAERINTARIQLPHGWSRH